MKKRDSESERLNISTKEHQALKQGAKNALPAEPFRLYLDADQWAAFIAALDASPRRPTHGTSLK